jgi:uncharacterized protein (DUF1778 family)
MKTKNEHIDILLNAKDKALWENARQLAGDPSLESFVKRVMKEHAQLLVERHNPLLAGEADRRVFFEIALGDAKPNQTLQEAAIRYLRSKKGA